MNELISEEYVETMKKFEAFEIQVLLSSPYDDHNAIFRNSSRCWWYGIARLGEACCFVCICVGLKNMAIALKQWIIKMGMKQGIKSVTLFD